MKKTILLFLLISALYAHAEHLTITNASGSVFSFNVDSAISLGDVLESIRQHENTGRDVQITMQISGDKINAVTKPYVKGDKRDYYADLTPQQKEDIAYIVKTLANQPLLKIGTTSRGSLEKAGNRIDSIHPLKFLQFIFSNEELIVCMRNLKGRSWVWKEFLNNTVGSLKDEHAIGNIRSEHVNEFAAKVNVDVKVIHPHIQKQEWENLVTTLISVVPRKGDSKRYDM